MATLLVIDDDRSIARLVENAFHEAPELRVISATSAQEGIDRLQDQTVDAVLLDVNLPDFSGLEAFRKIQTIDPKLPVIFITAGGASETAIEAMKLGAYDYVLKPLDLPHLGDLVRQTLEIRRMMHAHKTQQQPVMTVDSESLVGRTAEMQEVYKAIGRVATQNVTVLIRGESGTGKELVARAIYQHSNRAPGPFLAVNCAALTETLLESELFGHEKGSFTGAAARRIGKFEQCTGGTLFMDEVGDMSPVMQSKVLRVLQDQQFERVGGTETIRTDVRIIAATNRDLGSMVATGEFREDLYYRLNGFSISIPPLRERKDDLPLLLEWFLNRFGRELGKDVQGFSPDAMEILLNYSWPGNVRQLQSVVRQSLVNANGPVLLAEMLPEEIRESQSKFPSGNNERCDLIELVHGLLRTGSTNIYSESLAAMEHTVIAEVLKAARGNQSKAAAMLGITRGSLRNKIRLLGICIDHTVKLNDGRSSAIETDEPVESQM